MREQQNLQNQEQQQVMNQILTRLGTHERVNDDPHRKTAGYGGNQFQFNPKVEFPCFDGHDPKGWIKKCTRYFSLCRIQDEQKVDLAALHLRGLGLI